MQWPLYPKIPLLLLLCSSHLTPLFGLPLFPLQRVLCYGGEEVRGEGVGKKRSYGALGILLFLLFSGRVRLKLCLGKGNLAKI